ncbi:hypothetical protein [Photobacterium damselae]|uniref:hypothetical protein n=1 Tax=Photobacterium damselae TaxID=38293 RepID=UPI0035A8611D
MLGELLKPGSVILGLMIIIQFLHKILDSSRVYKIKQLELLHACMKDLSNPGSAYTIEKLLERTYKVQILYDQAIVMMAHPQRQQLFNLYKAAYKYLDFDNGRFSLLLTFQSKKNILIENYKYDAFKMIKYYGSSMVAAITIIIAFEVFYKNGLFETLFLTFNIIWFICCLTLSAFLLFVAFVSLLDPTSIKQAIKFKEIFDSNKVNSKAIWMY